MWPISPFGKVLWVRSVCVFVYLWCDQKHLGVGEKTICPLASCFCDFADCWSCEALMDLWQMVEVMHLTHPLICLKLQMSLFDYYYLFELIYSSILVDLFPNELLLILAVWSRKCMMFDHFLGIFQASQGQKSTLNKIYNGILVLLINLFVLWFYQGRPLSSKKISP